MNQLLKRFQFWLWQSQRANVYRDLADAFTRNMSMKDFFETEVQNARTLKDEAKLTTMRALLSRYSSGDYPNLQELFAPVVPSSDLLLLAAVDSSKDKRPEALAKAADAVDFLNKSRKTLIKNILEPLAYAVIVGAVCYYTAQSINSIAKSAPPSIWTGFNGIVRSLSDFITGQWIPIVAITIAIVGGLFYFLPRLTGSLRIKLDRLPLFSLYRDYHSANVITSLAMMMSSGKQLTESLELLRARTAPWLRWQLTRILNALNTNPNDYDSAFSKGLFSPQIRARITSLRKSSKGFEEVLSVLGTTELKRLETNIEGSAKQLNMLLVVLIVLVAGVLTIGLISITTSMTTASDPSKVMMR